ncbi:MAG: DUF1016 family protein [Deltaproteobacteria bacterium]|nr:DUF1016 family protein [Deltaproteobacteria bacterium]
MAQFGPRRIRIVDSHRYDVTVSPSVWPRGTGRASGPRTLRRVRLFYLTFSKGSALLSDRRNSDKWTARLSKPTAPEIRTALLPKSATIENAVFPPQLGWTHYLGFVARQRRLSLDGDHFYVDTVLHNRLLRCFVLVDLKLGKLTHQDLGQIMMYVNWFDRFQRAEHEQPTVGILLCSDKNDAVVKRGRADAPNARSARGALAP